MRYISFVLLLALIGAVFAAAEQKVSDDWIYDHVRQRLTTHRDVKGGGIEVEVKEGVVTLKGKVAEAKQKTKAEQVARKVKGVKKVINELVVELPAARQQR